MREILRNITWMSNDVKERSIVLDIFLSIIIMIMANKHEETITALKNFLYTTMNKALTKVLKKLTTYIMIIFDNLI